MTAPSATRQRGVALVLAMGVVALAAMAAAATLASQSTWSRHIELASQHAQAQALVLAGIDWARAVLGDDRRVSNVDHLGEPWAMRLPPAPVDGGELAGHIEDQQGAFNLNNLVRNGAVSPAQVEHFGRLLNVLGLPETLAGSLAGWLKPADTAVTRSLVDVAELAQVPGFDAAVCARLRPFVSALPRFTTVNVNTAPAEVLAAVVRGLHLDDARTLAAQREQAYFRNVTEFLAQLPAGAAVEGGDIGTISQYFLASMRVTIGDAQARGSALLAHEQARWPAVVWRKSP
jgi:general secretion pathway protein K